ncbi:hypothetical protein GW17_00036486 [Ensete ventricosum]|nr:hypothetical protein GW17_00036486 [Ensete ventricosum]RZS02661.1 hypothetical protein BHM03_00032729 [Ensete ventricosum]
MVGSAEMVSMSLMRDNPRTGGRAFRNYILDPGSSTTASVGPARRVWVSLQCARDPVEEGLYEPPAPRQRPKSVRVLWSARAGVDDRDYHAIRMCNFPERASDAPLEPDLRPLTHGMPIW